MPVIFVHGTPANVAGHTLEKVLEGLQRAVASIEELKITKDQVTVFFPPDRVEKGLGEELIVMIEGLYARPERTAGVLNRLAQKCAQVVHEHFRSALVECFVQTVDQAAGTWCIPRSTDYADTPVCDVCGTQTVRQGACYKCLNCGNAMGCD